MFEPDPEKWEVDDSVIFALSMALFGSFVNWATKMRAIRARPNLGFFLYAVLELCYDIIVGAFVGLLTILAMYRIGADFVTCGVAAGAAGHAGPRLLFIIRKFMLQKTGKYLEDNLDNR